LTNSEAQKTIAFTVGQSSTQSKAILVPSSAVTTNEVQSVSFTEQGTATAKSTSTSSLQGFVIVSNGASTANGQMTIVVSAILDSRSVGNTFRIVGKASTIYFSSSYPIASGEFAGGIMYVDYDESNNGGKTYSVVSNTSSSITLSVAITPPGNQQASSSTDITTVTTTPDVYEGETIRLVQSSGIGEAWVTFDNPWDTNALVGQPITVVHNKGGTSYGVIISNTSRTIMVTGINRAHYSSGDLFTFSMPIFIPVPSFSMTDTTIDLDHYHSNNLVGEWIRGGISSISLLSSSEAIAVITVSNPSGLANPLLVANPTLLQGEKITFYSPDGTIAFQETVSLVYPTSIVIDVVNANDWNLNGFGSYGINSTYLWEIDASAYGQTANPTYVDFIVYSTKLIQNAALGSSILNVPDPSKFINGDMVEIFDSSGTIQSATVISSISYVTISVPLQKTFSMTNGASVRILRNSFPENHTHMIKNGEVYSASVEEYQAVGYPLSHNHVLTSSLSNVACLKSDGLGRTYAGGSSNEILVTLDGGNTWQESISLNDLCSNTTCIGVDYTGKVAVGTGCGFIAAQATSLNEEANPVEVPIIDDSSSSSESSESSSSNSSSSSSSKSSISSSSSLSSNVFLG
jgi:hypothetical protein